MSPTKHSMANENYLSQKVWKKDILLLEPVVL